MLTNPKVGQQVIYISKFRNIHTRATVVRADKDVVIQLNDVGTVLFVELGDEIDHVRGT